MQTKSRQYLVIGGIIVVLLGIIGFFTLRGSSSEKAEDNESVFEEPAEVIPTVDSSVRVKITGSKDAEIEISGIPDGTEEIEYELSYNTKSGSIEGVFGSVMVEGASEATEKVTFGTCSSGVCRYHSIDGPVKGTFKFSGSYGKKLLEKSFEI